MKKSFKIAQLSDLHCNSKEEWKSLFQYIINCLEKIQPNIIFVTGDLVHNPRKKHFKTLTDCFYLIKNNNKLPSNLHIVSVPGNHDYYIYGNNIFNLLNKKKIYKSFEDNFFHPYDGDCYDVLKSILINFNIALFPLDSNWNTFKIGSAEGRIESPIIKFQEYKNFYHEISDAFDINYESSLKITILHHHPLPIATSRKDETIEKFLTLRNSYQFLESCRVMDIDIILHGHKHMSNLMNYTFFRNKDKTITISSCSTSGTYNADRREIKLIEVSSSGTINFKSYFSTQHDNDFVEESTRYETRYYGDIRKFNNLNCGLMQPGTKSPISNIKNKTKIISILDSGSAFITISLANIKWKDNIHHNEKIIQERIRSDLGRVSGGFFEFSQCPITGDGIGDTWKHPSMINDTLPDPEKEDGFIKQFVPSNPASGSNEDCFKLNYILSSGFALTKREHEERYGKWDEDKPRQEYASISIDYPTDSIELIVKFPPDFYPPVKGIYIEAVEKEDIAKEPSLKMLRGELIGHKEETQFILKKSALRTRPEINAVAVFIKYPQPHLEYILRWNLQDDDYREFDLGPESKRRSTILADELHKPDNSYKVIKLYDEIIQFAKTEVFFSDQLVSFLLLHNAQKNYLDIVRCDEDLRNKVTGKIIIGRGPAGKSFKLRKAVFWEKGCGPFAEYGIPDYPIEGVVKGLRPVKVFAMPLVSPAYIAPDGQVGDQERYICPAWGCLSLVSEGEDGFQRLSGLPPEKQTEELGAIYTCINKQVSKCVKRCFPETFPA